ncbi:hypothetical protein ACVGVM_09555 [Pseudonocardia bannensis]|uniref:Uncharacterized protein n=1 Tax=Pseudonocardia bannensis TaxID=630973 RepID=A0A848DG52_9PSEU|nr:hypothetical protein [Pseudonocardia bannensis]NMH91617.1 hypothetical protein [Pseudonocardia bannensis]
MRTGAGPRGTLALAVGLAALLLAGGVAAWLLGSRVFDGVAPAGAAPSVPEHGAGSATVELSADAGAHPAGAAVRAQLQRYFDAINARDYASWTTTVMPQRVEQQPEPQWRAGLETTTDGTIRIDRIADLDGGRVLVLVRFVSTQDPADAPADLQAPRICWRGALPMSGDPPRLETGRAGSLLSEAC